MRDRAPAPMRMGCRSQFANGRVGELLSSTATQAPVTLSRPGPFFVFAASRRVRAVQISGVPAELPHRAPPAQR
jgi:hypothetical protein